MLFPFLFLGRCVEQISKASRGDISPEELKERQVLKSFFVLGLLYLKLAKR